MLFIREAPMSCNQQSESTSVRTNDPIVTPFLLHDRLEDRMNHHRRAIPGVVSGHSGSRTPFLKAHTKRHRVVLAEKTIIEIRRRVRPTVFVFICEKVLHQRCGAPAFWIDPLQSTNEPNSHRTDEVRVFSHRFFRSPPARVAAQIDVRSSQDDTSKTEGRILVIKARLFALECSDLVHKRRIPGFAQALLLRKDRCWQWLVTAGLPMTPTAQRKTVQTFRLVREDKMKARYLRMAFHQLNLF